MTERLLQTLVRGQIDWLMTLPHDQIETFECFNDQVQSTIDGLQQHFHAMSEDRGWWTDPITGLSLIPGHGKINAGLVSTVIEAWFPYVIATKIALIHSEVSEGLEAYRTDAVDDKLPELQGITVEMADVLIRVFDLMRCLQLQAKTNAMQLALDLGYALFRKGGSGGINSTRRDHDLEARRQPGGKKF